ncbi:MAG TPA: serine hydrolase domain-containing protein [Thermoanaerobaculia bacterium]|jgi:CubicO group peptidase (beta-lactamase class C family)|nr:serine hydrolase domain-containing protein [Thermoanaerobaculia bacterium]
MRRVPLLLLVLTLACATQSGEKTITRLDRTRISIPDASKLAREILTAQHVTGAQIAVVDRGQLVWSESFGMRSLDPPLPMARTTTTWAASITKSVFATYVMQLAERGEFDLDTPIATQLPKPLDQYEPYRETASLVVQDPRWPRVTPRMLLSHKSGLRNFASIEDDKKMHIHLDPGTRFSYSGDGINLLQFVIEQKKQRPLDVLMQEAIFTPLGMTRTGMVFRPEFEANIADRYDTDGKFRSKTRRAAARAAGSMTSTADDLARFASAFFTSTIIKPATRREMLAPAIMIPTLHQFFLKLGEPEGTEGRAVGLAYGLGWGLLTRTPYGPAFFKEGHGDGAQNYMICFERRQACMIILTNSDNGELAFRPLLEGILGDTVTPWEWEGYTPAYIDQSRKNGN